MGSKQKQLEYTGAEQSFNEFHLHRSIKLTRLVFVCGAAVVYLMSLLTYMGYTPGIPQWYIILGAAVFAPSMLLFALALKLPQYQPHVRKFFILTITQGWGLNLSLLLIAPWSLGGPLYIEAIYILLISVYLFSPLRLNEAMFAGLVPSAAALALISVRVPVWEDVLYTLVFLIGFNAVGIAARTTAESSTRRLHWMHQRLTHLATKDPLTLLPNRRGFDQHVSALNADEWSRSEAGVAFMIFDLDDFKIYNDKYGHPTGDRLLRALGNRLISLSNDAVYDMPARFGGDEFAGIWHCDNEQEAQRLAEYLRKKLEEVIRTDGVTHPSSIGLSVGAAWQPAHHKIVLPRLYERADKALYEAKKSGKGTAKLRLIEKRPAA